MKAQALICDEQQRFSLREVSLPDPGPDRLLVRCLVSGISIGTEFALIRNKISWGPYPLCTGYQAVGRVEVVGESVSGYEAGHLVYYRDNKLLADSGGGPLSPVAGTHCSWAVIDPSQTHGLSPLPQGCPLEAGALFVMPAVGLAGVDMAGVRLGERVVVYGCGQIGLGVVAACVLRGARVLAVDLQARPRELAAGFGAEQVLAAQGEDLAAAVEGWAPGGADVVFESTGRPEGVPACVALARSLGRLVLQGNYGAAPLSFDFLAAHGRRLTWYFPCDDGQVPARRAVTGWMASGALPWQRVITHRVTPDQAPALYERINRGAEPDLVGAVILWSP